MAEGDWSWDCKRTKLGRIKREAGGGWGHLNEMRLYIVFAGESSFRRELLGEETRQGWEDPAQSHWTIGGTWTHNPSCVSPNPLPSAAPPTPYSPADSPLGPP
ncbi:hypothetical protein N7495_007967 [Penicillium taxi]|uniref:uncharacterized protein n=1 Tax=Penicillium taxi TaxID=168475 RepID=UPI00254575CF|nr:uncharacterized protein N7495_007967 [Penicillium taxi]KAJ5887926.1 hypothetical protein N7495_007967 [Penicillium taxi]